MSNIHTRTKILLGQKIIEKLRNYHVLIAGIGGVGGYVAENLSRAGIGQLTLLDGDIVNISNTNRQLVALQSTIGEKKTIVMKNRIADIDPTIKINLINEFMSVEKVKPIISSIHCDFIADCIDSIACKAQLILTAQQYKIPIISAMGAGNRIDASKVCISTLEKAQGCPLARKMRRQLRKLKANLKYPVIYSNEQCQPPHIENMPAENYHKTINGTISYMPAIFGVLLAGEIIKNIIANTNNSINHTFYT